jgi:hypothetical protein
MDVYIVLIEDKHVKPGETIVLTDRQRALAVAQKCAEEQAESYGTAVEVETEHDPQYYPDVIYHAACCEDPESDVWVLVRQLDADATFRL